MARRRSPYENSRLDPGKREIRVLQILPGNFDDLIRCTFTTTTVDDADGLHALSYVWGDASKTRDMILNDSVASITVNLYICLQYLRQSSGFHYATFWVDALSINQEDQIEVGHQIGLMKAIYSTAQSVIIWLGKGVEHDLKFVQEYPAEPSGEQGYQLTQALEAIGRSHWFRRLWVLQEYVLARGHLWFMSGKTVASWSVFTGKQDIYATHPKYPHLGLLAYNHATNGVFFYQSLREEYARHGGIDLLRLVARSSHSLHATEPEDYVYGISALFSDEDRSFLPLKHQCSREELFRSLMCLLFEKGQGLSFLSKCSFLPSFQLSWAPDLSVQPSTLDPPILTGKYRSLSFSTGLHLPGPLINPDFPDTLTVHGISFWKVLDTRRMGSTSFEIAQNLIEAEQVSANWKATSANPIFDEDNTLSSPFKRWLFKAGYKNCYEPQSQPNEPRLTDDKSAEILPALLDTERYKDVGGCEEAWSAWIERMEQIADNPSANAQLSDDERLGKPPHMVKYACISMERATMLRLTDGGLVAFGTDGILPGDEVVLFDGATILFALRPCGEHHRFAGRLWIDVYFDRYLSKYLRDQGLNVPKKYTLK